ncbi:TRAP transporter small permease [Marinobacter manganoxydans]|jgi:TRAP-type C4-dicarboxylate transport system permease small subunit|uniref:TRAP transporter small permease protein n=1 Tax=Marinobacter manganoxydans MnI7-9 TaxID=1094979 RepID=G6YYT1_9GAMM|nr:TRAP transporter small permease [Marinobacter manganoxydans]EHJ02473.1 C4-dicarboxylate transport system permease small protein [Marinobacter manganoxydans MnI7-9]
MYQYLDKFGQGLAFGSQAVGAVTALVMIGSLLLGVFYRYVLGDALVWSDEVAALAFTWTVFLFASALVRSGGHVRVTLLVNALPPLLGELVERGIMVLIIGFGLVMFWNGWNFAEFTAGQVSPAIRYPVWMKNAAVPVGGALISIHALILLIRPQPIHKSSEH